MRLSQRLALGYIRSKFRILSALSPHKAAEAAFRLFCTPQSRNRKKLPPVFNEGENISFELDGVTVKGWRFNHPAEKKALIVHGFESSVINFDRYIKPLVKKGYEVLAFDAPAHGRSGGKTITAPLYKKTIIQIHKQFGPVDSFIAHSFGGLALMLAMEDISHTVNTRIVLIAPATETVSAIDSFFNFLRLNPAIRPQFEKVIIQKGGVSPEWYSIRRAMRNIRAHILWFHDEEDMTTPLKDAIRVRDDHHQHVQFVITTGLGHSRIYRDNKVKKTILEFL